MKMNILITTSRRDVKVKKKITWIVVGSLILLIPLIFIVYNKMKIQNIFDEIYYVGVEATGETLEKPRSVLGDIPTMKARVSNLTNISDNGEKITQESYEESELPSGFDTFSITFYSKQKKMIIDFSYSVNSTIYIRFKNSYNPNKKTLEQSIYFVDSDKKNNMFITDKKSVDEYMETYNISKEQLKTWY
ncbi:TipC family immunity protein, partial [Listeria monocytogenes]|nr:TipC family immunity protein [Listeria monocytogenes]